MPLQTYLDIGTPWRERIPAAMRMGPTFDGDIYQFGVFTGGSLRVIRKTLIKHNLLRSVPHVWGFDSFVGLGDEDPSVEQLEQTDVQRTWKRGAYSASKALNMTPSDGLAEHIVRHISGPSFKSDAFAQRMTFVYGFFNQSLVPTLAASYRMRPALYVDIDVDQYLPAKQALRWMFESGLIRNGTLIGYDDFGNTRLWIGGESRAHLEIAHEYNVSFRLMNSECMVFCPYQKEYDPRPCKGMNYHPIFRVISVGHQGRVC